MSRSLLEEIAMKWSFGHTIAVAAWAVVLVLGLTLLFRGEQDAYPVTDTRKVYAGENATFAYPANWTINNCVPKRAFIELPGTIKANYKDKKGYGLKIEGTTAYGCSKDRPERFHLYPETIVASENPCAPATSTQGERLANGLYLRLAEEKGEVYGVSIHQNSCFAPADASVLTFTLVDPESDIGDDLDHGMPRIKQEDFLKSNQYKDIRTLAEGMRY